MDKDLVFSRLTLMTFMAAYLASTLVIIVSGGLFKIFGLVLLIVSFVVLCLIIKRLRG